MRAITWTDTGNGEAVAIERQGYVWAPGPRPHTVWVALAEVVDAGLAPRSDEMVVVSTRDLRKVTRVWGFEGTSVSHLDAGTWATGDQGRRIEARGYVTRYGKAGEFVGENRGKALSEREWVAMTGGAVDDAQMALTAA